MQTSETYMIGGVPASINSAIPPCYSHAAQNGITPEHAGALGGQRRLGELRTADLVHADRYDIGIESSLRHLDIGLDFGLLVVPLAANPECRRPHA